MGLYFSPIPGSIHVMDTFSTYLLLWAETSELQALIELAELRLFGELEQVTNEPRWRFIAPRWIESHLPSLLYYLRQPDGSMMIFDGTSWTRQRRVLIVDTDGKSV